MNSEYKNNIDYKEEKTIDLRELFMKWLHHWHWFLISVLLVAVTTAYYLRRTTPEYSVSATILIKDAKQGVGGSISETNAFQDLGMFSNSHNSLENEIEILKSRSLAAKVIKELNLNVQYKREGHIRTREYYNTTPVQLRFLETDSIQDEISVKFKLTILSDTQYSIENEELGSMGSFSFGNRVSTSYGDLMFVPHFSEIPSNPVVYISVSPLLSIANSYSKRINVEPISRKTSVINISLVDAVKDRAQDYINTLIKQYNADGVDEKNQVSKNTADFIAKRLDLIHEELNQVESTVASYKQSQELTNINAETTLFLKNTLSTKKEALRLSTKLRMVQFMADYLLEDNKRLKLLPTNIGLTDESISVSVSTFNTLILDRNRLLKNSSLKNPVIQNIDAQLIELEQLLSLSLQNLQQALNLQLAGLDQEVQQNSSRITAVPQQEKEFRAIQRQQEIKEALYLYLLQKREETAISLAVTVANAKIVDSAFINHSPVKPKKQKTWLGAIIMGLLFPVVLIYIQDLLDTKIHSRKDIEDAINVPVLGEIPLGDEDQKLVVELDKRSNVAEAFRLIRTNLNFLLTANPSKEAKVIGVTSTMAGEGKSFVSLNLATTIALSGKKVLLVGLDLRKPKLLEYFGIRSQGKGITHYLSDSSIKVSDLIFSAPNNVENMDLIESGVIAPNPAELLLNPRLSELFREIRSKYDYIVVDTAPVNLVTDTLLINEYMDMFIYVARANYLDKRLLEVPCQSFYYGI